MDITDFSISDYDEARSFWAGIEGVELDDADSRSVMEAYLERNPGMSFVARHDGKIVGAVLCGHDGRRGYLHHLAVLPEHRGAGVGRALVDRCLSALASAGIQKCNIFVFAENRAGIGFWKRTGWSEYDDLVLMFKKTGRPDHR